MTLAVREIAQIPVEVIPQPEIAIQVPEAVQRALGAVAQVEHLPALGTPDVNTVDTAFSSN